MDSLPEGARPVKRKSPWPRISPETGAAIIRGYTVEKKSCIDLAAETGRSFSAICGYLHRHGIPIRTPAENRKYALDEAAFDDADKNPEAAYWVGFLQADGVLVKHAGSYVLEISLAVVDRAHVEACRTFLGSNHPIRERESRGFCADRPSPMASLSITCQHLARSLLWWGVTPRKSLTARSNGLEGSPAFWTGVIDGDGCLDWRAKTSGTYMRLRLAGSRPLMEQYLAFVRLIVPAFQGGVRPHLGIWQVSLEGGSAYPVVKALYRDRPYALARKLATAQDMLTRCNGGGKAGGHFRLPEAPRLRP